MAIVKGCGESINAVQRREVPFVPKAPHCHIFLIWPECKIPVIQTGKDTFCPFPFTTSHYTENDSVR